MVAMASMAMMFSSFVVICGVVISIVAEDWSWLSRSGSLVVAYGILFAAQGIDAYVERIRGENITVQYQGKEIPGPATPEEKEDLVKYIRWVQRSTEVRILIFGTLVWGFGDLPNWIISLF